MINQEMLESLQWEHDDYDIDWCSPVNGYTEGACYYYGCRGDGNLPYPVLRRDIDGLVAFPPANKDDPFCSSDWLSEFRGKNPESKKMLVAVELIEGSPAGVIIHGIFLSMDSYNQFRATWTPAHGYGSSVQAVVAEIKS